MHAKTSAALAKLNSTDNELGTDMTDMKKFLKKSSVIAKHLNGMCIYMYMQWVFDLWVLEMVCLGMVDVVHGEGGRRLLRSPN